MTSAQFIIGIDDENKNYMKWQDSRNNNKQHHPYEIIDFVCDNILKQLKGTKQINGFTQYKKIININPKEIVLFRSHPSYRSDSIQKLPFGTIGWKYVMKTKSFRHNCYVSLHLLIMQKMNVLLLIIYSWRIMMIMLQFDYLQNQNKDTK